jgi:hypothetical protein
MSTSFDSLAAGGVFGPKVPRMSRAQFELIASVLLAERPERDGTSWADGAHDEWSTVVLRFASVLASTNPRFDSERFLTAAGYLCGGGQ